MSQTRAQLLKGFSNTSAPDDAIIVNSSGNVAIGTTTATTRLDVEGNGVPIEINSANSNSNKVQLSDGGTVRGYLGASSTASFLVSSSGVSEQLRVQSAGGISFNGDTASVNALNDYEEGTWVPSLTASSGTITSISGTSGRYTKIGRTVYVTFAVTINVVGTASGAYLTVSGLPFPAHGTGAQIIQQGTVREQSVNGFISNVNLGPNGTAVGLHRYDNGGIAVSSGNYHGSITYDVA